MLSRHQISDCDVVCSHYLCFVGAKPFAPTGRWLWGIDVLMLTRGCTHAGVKMGIPLYLNMKLGGGIPPRRYGVSLAH